MRIFSAIVALVFLSTNILFAHVPQKNVWEERRQQRPNPSVTPSLAWLFQPAHPALPTVPSFQFDPSGSGAHLKERSSEIGSAPFPTLSEKHRFTVAGSPTDSTVYVIQDIHLNFEAQSNIASFLTGLVREGTLGLVGVEGAAGRFNFDPFRSYPETSVTRDVADYYLVQNKIGAPSYVGVVAPNTPPITVGLESVEHYRENILAYQEAARIRRPLEEKRKALKKTLTDQMAHLPERTRAVDRILTGYSDGTLPLRDYVRELQRVDPGLMGFLPAVEKEMLERFVMACSIEESLDFAQASEEKSKAVMELSRRIQPEDMAALARSSAAFRSGALTAAEYFGRLERLFHRTGVSLEKRPMFKKYLLAVILGDSINADILLKAAADLGRHAIRRQAQNGAEARLLNASQGLNLVGKLFSFRLTPSEWKECDAWLTAQKTETAAGDDFGVRSLVIHAGPFVKFYRLADLRSEKIVENFLGLSSPGKNRVLVVGGFHAPEITRLFVARRIPYVLLTPKLTKVEDSNGADYLEVFSREKAPLEKLFSGEKLFINPPNLALGTPGIDIPGVPMPPNEEFIADQRASGRLRQAGADPVVSIDLNGTVYEVADGHRPLPRGYRPVDGPKKIGRTMLQYVVAAPSLLRDMRTRLQQVGRAWANVFQWVRLRAREYRYLWNNPYLAAILLVLAWMMGKEDAGSMAMMSMVIGAVKQPEDDGVDPLIRELRLNFDPRFHVAAMTLLEKLQGKKPDQWTPEEIREFARLRRQAQQAYDWMTGWIRKSPYYASLKGNPPTLLSAEGIVSAFMEGKGIRLASYAGGLGVLFGEWIRAIAYLGGVTDLTAARDSTESDAPQFFIVIPNYRYGIRKSKINASGFPENDARAVLRPQDLGIGLVMDPEKPGEPLTVPVSFGWDGEVNVQFRNVSVGMLSVIMPETDSNTDDWKANILDVLYTGNASSFARFRQEWTIGLAAYAMRKRFTPAAGPIHLNETATFPFLIGALRDHLEEFVLKGYRPEDAFEAAIELTGARTVFFTHTLVDEGIDKFDPNEVQLKGFLEGYFYDSPILRSHAGAFAHWLAYGMNGLPHFLHAPTGKFHPMYFVATLAQRFGGRIAAVSQYNAQMAGEFLADQQILTEEDIRKKPVVGVTNGVDSLFWMIPFLARFMRWWRSDPAERLGWKILNPQDPGAKEIFEIINPDQPAPAVLVEGKRKPFLSDHRLRQLLRSYKVKAIQMIRDNVKEQRLRHAEEIHELFKDGRISQYDRERYAALQSQWVAWTGNFMPKVENLTPDALEALRGQELVNLMDPDRFLTTWARRIVPYKRMLLVVFGKHLRQVEDRIGGRNSALSLPEIDALVDEMLRAGGLDEFIDLVVKRGQQFVFAGPTFSPAGESMVAILHRLIERLSTNPDHPEWAVIQNRVVFLEGYNETVSQFLVRGSDIWLNTPKRPLEASGTSGMKAILNLFAVLDGWGASGIKNWLNGLVGYQTDRTHPDTWAYEHRFTKEALEYLDKEAAGLYKTLRQAQEAWADTTSSNWLNLVRRSIYYLASVYDVRGEFTGRNVPSFSRIPGGYEPGILRLYSDSQNSYAAARLWAETHFVPKSLRVDRTGEKTKVILEVRIPEEIRNHVDIVIHWGPKDKKDEWVDYTVDHTELEQLAAGKYRATIAIVPPHSGTYEVTAFLRSNFKAGWDPSYRQLEKWWGRWGVDDVIFQARKPTSKAKEANDPPAAPGAVGLWKKIGVTKLSTIGWLEGIIIVGILYAGLWILFTAGMMPMPPPQFDQGVVKEFILAILPSYQKIIFLPLGVLLILVHRFGGVLQPNRSAVKSWIVSYKATVVALSSFVALPFLIRSFIHTLIPGDAMEAVFFGIYGLVVGAGLHAFINWRIMRKMRRLQEIRRDVASLEITPSVPSNRTLRAKIYDYWRIRYPKTVFSLYLYWNLIVHHKVPVVATDLNNTLLRLSRDSSKSYLYWGVANMVRETLNEGPLVLVTGDAYPTVHTQLFRGLSVPDEFTEDQLRNIGVVSLSGLDLQYFEGRSLLSRSLMAGLSAGDCANALRIVRGMVQEKEWMSFSIVGKNAGDVVLRKAVEGYALLFQPAGELSSERGGEKFSVRELFAMDTENLERVERIVVELNRRFQEAGLGTVKARRSGFSSIDVSYSSKGMALAELETHIAENEYFVYFGDSLYLYGNDADAMTVAEIGVQMGIQRDLRFRPGSGHHIVFSRRSAADGAAAEYAAIVNRVRRIARLFRITHAEPFNNFIRVALAKKKILEGDLSGYEDLASVLIHRAISSRTLEREQLIPNFLGHLGRLSDPSMRAKAEKELIRTLTDSPREKAIVYFHQIVDVLQKINATFENSPVFLRFKDAVWWVLASGVSSNRVLLRYASNEIQRDPGQQALYDELMARVYAIRAQRSWQHRIYGFLWSKTPRLLFFLLLLRRLILKGEVPVIATAWNGTLAHVGATSKDTFLYPGVRSALWKALEQGPVFLATARSVERITDELVNVIENENDEAKIRRRNWVLIPLSGLSYHLFDGGAFHSHALANGITPSERKAVEDIVNRVINKEGIKFKSAGYPEGRVGVRPSPEGEALVYFPIGKPDLETQQRFSSDMRMQELLLEAGHRILTEIERAGLSRLFVTQGSPISIEIGAATKGSTLMRLAKTHLRTNEYFVMIGDGLYVGGDDMSAMGAAKIGVHVGPKHNVDPRPSIGQHLLLSKKTADHGAAADYIRLVLAIQKWARWFGKFPRRDFRVPVEKSARVSGVRSDTDRRRSFSDVNGAFGIWQRFGLPLWTAGSLETLLIAASAWAPLAAGMSVSQTLALFVGLLFVAHYFLGVVTISREIVLRDVRTSLLATAKAMTSLVVVPAVSIAVSSPGIPWWPLAVSVVIGSLWHSLFNVRGMIPLRDSEMLAILKGDFSGLPSLVRRGYAVIIPSSNRDLTRRWLMMRAQEFAARMNIDTQSVSGRRFLSAVVNSGSGLVSFARHHAAESAMFVRAFRTERGVRGIEINYRDQKSVIARGSDQWHVGLLDARNAAVANEHGTFDMEHGNWRLFSDARGSTIRDRAYFGAGTRIRVRRYFADEGDGSRTRRRETGPSPDKTAVQLYALDHAIQHGDAPDTARALDALIDLAPLGMPAFGAPLSEKQRFDLRRETSRLATGDRTGFVDRIYLGWFVSRFSSNDRLSRREFDLWDSAVNGREKVIYIPRSTTTRTLRLEISEVARRVEKGRRAGKLLDVTVLLPESLDRVSAAVQNELSSDRLSFEPLSTITSLKALVGLLGGPTAPGWSRVTLAVPMGAVLPAKFQNALWQANQQERLRDVIRVAVWATIADGLRSVSMTINEFKEMKAFARRVLTQA